MHIGKENIGIIFRHQEPSGGRSGNLWPVNTCWMHPIEKYLKTLKGYIQTMLNERVAWLKHLDFAPSICKRYSHHSNSVGWQRRPINVSWDSQRWRAGASPLTRLSTMDKWVCGEQCGTTKGVGGDVFMLREKILLCTHFLTITAIHTLSLWVNAIMTEYTNILQSHVMMWLSILKSTGNEQFVVNKRSWP